MKTKSFKKLPKEEAMSTQCLGKTVSGARCKAITKNANNYCFQHQGQVPPAPVPAPAPVATTNHSPWPWIIGALLLVLTIIGVVIGFMNLRPNPITINVPQQPVNITVFLPTPLPPAATLPAPIVTQSPVVLTGNFGEGYCDINGTTYNLMVDSSAVWMDSETQKVLASYGGTCSVTTVKEGWYWSVGNGTIMHDSVQMERGNALNATPGYWTFTYDAPAAGTTNESLGLTFRDNLPQVETSNDAFGTGTCTINGQNYFVAYDATAVWEDDETLRQLWQYGGSCTVTTVRNGWYWSTTGTITLNGQIMANGQRLVAPAGNWTFVYEGGGDANGFTIRDNVPFGQ